MADDKNSAMFSNTNQLFPNKSTGQKPRVDSLNFRGVTENTLKLREYKGQYGGGVGGGAWYAIWMLILSSIIVLSGDFIALIKGVAVSEDWFIGVIGMLAATAAFSPFFILWRIELPVCFNRKTRKVSFWIKGQLAQVNWDEIEAYTKLARSVAAGSGAPIKEQIVAFNIFTQASEHYEPEEHNVTISGTDYWDKDDPVAGAKALWEYAYLFMERGKQALPEDKVELKGYSLMEALRENNPLPHKGLDWVAVVVSIVLLPITIPLYFITVPTDVIYTFLDRTLPRRKPPKPLREACEAQ